MISPLSAEDIPADAVALKTELTEMLPFAPIVSLLIELDRRTGFLDCFTHAGGKQTRTRELKRNLIAVLLSHCTNLGLARMADACGISYDILAWTSEWYVREETLRAANLALIGYHQTLPLTAIFGSGTLFSSDGQRFPTRGKCTTARAMNRYFAHQGLSTYSAVTDQHAAYGTKIIVATKREAHYVLDEILGNATEIPITEHATDTHGVTLITFGLFDLVGLWLSPAYPGPGQDHPVPGRAETGRGHCSISGPDRMLAAAPGGACCRAEPGAQPGRQCSRQRAGVGGRHRVEQRPQDRDRGLVGPIQILLPDMGLHARKKHLVGQRRHTASWRIVVTRPSPGRERCGVAPSRVSRPSDIPTGVGTVARVRPGGFRGGGDDGDDDVETVSAGGDGVSDLLGDHSGAVRPEPDDPGEQDVIDQQQPGQPAVAGLGGDGAAGAGMQTGHRGAGLHHLCQVTEIDRGIGRGIGDALCGVETGFSHRRVSPAPGGTRSGPAMCTSVVPSRRTLSHSDASSSPVCRSRTVARAVPAGASARDVPSRCGMEFSSVDGLGLLVLARGGGAAGAVSQVGQPASAGRACGQRAPSGPVQVGETHPPVPGDRGVESPPVEQDDGGTCVTNQDRGVVVEPHERAARPPATVATGPAGLDGPVTWDHGIAIRGVLRADVVAGRMLGRRWPASGLAAPLQGRREWCPRPAETAPPG
ncbi:Tn3 family transposase [Pseudonocardia nantongensis]